MASIIRKQIELVPPKFEICKEERITGDVTTCDLCSGSGGKYIDSRCPDFDSTRNNNEGYYKACRVCKGSGKVQPIVRIEWQSAGCIKEKYKTAIK